MLELKDTGQGIYVVWSTFANVQGDSAIGTIELRPEGYRAYSSRRPSAYVEEIGTHPTKELALAAFSEWWDRTSGNESTD